MRHVAAYLLAVLGGKAHPTEHDIKTILDAAGVEADDEKISKLLQEMSSKDLNEVIAAGRAKLSSVPSGGGGAPKAGGAPAAAPAASAGGAKDKEKPVEKPQEEEKEEEDEGLGFDLFA